MVYKKKDIQKEGYLPTVEQIAQEMAGLQNIEDYFGRDGMFSRLFGKAVEKMIEAELTDKLGYEKHDIRGNNSGNSRNGSYRRKIRSSAGDTQIEVARDRRGEFEPEVLKKHASSSSEIERKIQAMYARGMSVSDIREMLGEIYGIDVSSTLISNITQKIMPHVHEWQSRPLEEVYPIMYLDCIHVKLRRDHRIQNVAVYVALGVDLQGRKDILGHWVGTGAEGANYWLTVITELQQRGVKDILIACVDGLTGFADAIHSVFSQTMVQRCVVHQIRNSLKYVSWKDRKAFSSDLKRIYQAPTHEAAEEQLLLLSETWGGKYALAVSAWEKSWPDLAGYFDFPEEIRKLIYTTNSIESYNRQLRKTFKTKSVFPTEESVLKAAYLATQNVVKKWTMPIKDWHLILNQLSIRFHNRINL